MPLSSLQPQKVDKEGLREDYVKNKYKLHYIYREFTMDFSSMDLNALPKNASSLKFSKHNAHVMSLCLTLHVNLGLSLEKTSQALKDLYNISISHQQIANHCKTAAICILAMRYRHFMMKSGCLPFFGVTNLIFVSNDKSITLRPHFGQPDGRILFFIS